MQRYYEQRRNIGSSQRRMGNSAVMIAPNDQVDGSQLERLRVDHYAID